MSENSSAAAANPTKKLRKGFAGFPAWRLPKGTINATDEALEMASSSCGRWEIAYAGMVVFGVAAEFAIAGIHPPYDSILEQWGSAAANALIALGIVGEVLFSQLDARIQTELRARSNRQLALALKDATDAKLELAKFRARRELSSKQMNAVVTAAKPFAGLPYVAAVNSDDPELVNLIGTIVFCLGAGARWLGIDWPYPGDVTHCGVLPSPSIGLRAGVDDVMILFPQDNPTAEAGAKAVTVALKGCGIVASWAPTTGGHLMVLVGPKR